MNHVTHPLSSAAISIFSEEVRKFCYIKKSSYRLHFLILLAFLESLKISLTNMVIILMKKEKMATTDVLKTMVF